MSLASHELRTPVSVVSGYLRMLQRDQALSERQRKMVDEADKACTRLVSIITELSDVAKLDDGRTALQAEGLDVFALIREVAGETTEASDRNVRLELRGEREHAPIRGDRVFLKTTFSGLMRAVLREQLDQSVVIVDCTLRLGVITVHIGTEEQLAAIATHPQATFDDQRGGLGLILPIARRVVEGHRGRIWSPADSQGAATARSAIIVELPTADSL